MEVDARELLLQQWLQGSEPAFRHIFDHYYPRFVAFAFRSLRQRELAEELAMDVLLKIWQHKEHMHDVADFNAYVFQMLRNAITISTRKKILLTEALDLHDTGKWKTVADQPWSYKELQEWYEKCLNKLPARQRQVFILSRKEGLTYAQIAAELKISVYTVQNHIAASLEFLRAEWQEYQEVMPFIALTLGYCLY